MLAWLLSWQVAGSLGYLQPVQAGREPESWQWNRCSHYGVPWSDRITVFNFKYVNKVCIMLNIYYIWNCLCFCVKKKAGKFNSLNQFNFNFHAQCNISQHNKKQYNTIHYNTIQYNTVQYNKQQYKTTQHKTSKTIQYSTIQHNKILQIVLSH